MSTETTTGALDSVSDGRLISHLLRAQLEAASGDTFPLDKHAFQLSSRFPPDTDDITDYARNNSNVTLTTKNGTDHVARVSTHGGIPDQIKSHFNPSYGRGIAGVSALTLDQQDLLQSVGISDLHDLADAEPIRLAREVNDAIEQQTETISPEDLRENTSVTDNEAKALAPETAGKLAMADQGDLGAEHPTLMPANVTDVQQYAENQMNVSPLEVSDAEQAVNQAAAEKPAAPELVRKTSDTYTAYEKTGATPAAVVRDVDRVRDTVGHPRIAVEEDLDPTDERASYHSDIGVNAGAPVQTNLPILEDTGYEKIPRPAPEAHGTTPSLPVDDDGNVVPPAPVTEPTLNQQVDVLIANKLGRDTPVRLLGPAGSGKNYWLKYIAYRTNRGYRSIDANEETMPEDLFGPMTPNEDGKVVVRNGPLKQGLLNGDIIAVNEFPVMSAGAAMSLHRLLNEGKLLINSHGDLVEPHEEARVVVTMNPPTKEYRDSEPLNSATRERFALIEVWYPESQADEVESLKHQVNSQYCQIEEEVLERVVEFAHRTRKDNFGMRGLSPRTLTLVCENIIDGVAPEDALKNGLKAIAEPRDRPENKFDAIDNLF